MAGFNAAEAVEDLSYDFTKYVEDAKGEIPEPSSEQIDTYRNTMFGAIKELGLDPSDVQGGVRNLPLDKMYELVEQAGELQVTFLHAAADLAQIQRDVIDRLPFRVKQAFSGWIMGLFYNPED